MATKPVKVKRSYLTPKERADMVRTQRNQCACGCAQPLGTRFIAEHYTPVGLGNDQKPDCLLRYECALAKTKRDIKAIAKVKRIRKGKKPSKRKIASPGFDKRFKRGMDGKVKPR